MNKLNLFEFKLLQKFFLLFCCALPVFVSAQSSLYSDTANRKIVEAECNDMVFTKVEVIPSIMGGNRALADSLASYLKNQNASINGKATFIFVVTKNAALIGIEKLTGQLSSENVFTEALMNYSSMWVPALQNKRKVCAIVRLELEFDKEEILVKITQ